MFDWIADKLGLAPMAPFWRPGVAFALSTTSSLLTWIASDTRWTGIIFVFSIALAIWAWAECRGGMLAGFVASLIGFYLLLGTNTSLTILDSTPYGCVAIEGRAPIDCADAAARKAGGPPLGVRSHP